MSAPRPLIVALAAAALVVAGCGNAKEGLLTSKQANRLLASLEAARHAADDGRCNAARDAAQKGAEQASKLPSRVDSKLQNNLVDGFNHLAEQVNSDSD